MNKYTADYDRALYYIYKNEWDNLLLLMVRTQDDFLSKKIEHFLHAYHFTHSLVLLDYTANSLFRYLDHALDLEPVNISAITGY